MSTVKKRENASENRKAEWKFKIRRVMEEHSFLTFQWL